MRRAGSQGPARGRLHGAHLDDAHGHEGGAAVGAAVVGEAVHEARGLGPCFHLRVRAVKVHILQGGAGDGGRRGAKGSA